MKSKFKSASEDVLLKDYLEKNPETSIEMIQKEQEEILSCQPLEFKPPRNWKYLLRKALNPEKAQKQSLLNKTIREERKRKHNLTCPPDI
jgi:hypothetical protein